MNFNVNIYDPMYPRFCPHVGRCFLITLDICPKLLYLTGAFFTVTDTFVIDCLQNLTSSVLFSKADFKNHRKNLTCMYCKTIFHFVVHL